VVLLNAGLYLDLYRPRPIQRLLRLPAVGGLVARAIDERRFRRSFAAVFAPEHQPSEAELAQHWEAVARRSGQRQAHKLIRYLDERRVHRARWEAPLERGSVPLAFVWGLRDPVSGASIAERLRQRRPSAPFTALDDVGHYPQLEAPEITADALLRFLAAPEVNSSGLPRHPE
jgi:pimeloyl-ACP methyl ester carboxylesterase